MQLSKIIKIIYKGDQTHIEGFLLFLGLYLNGCTNFIVSHDCLTVARNLMLVKFVQYC